MSCHHLELHPARNIWEMRDGTGVFAHGFPFLTDLKLLLGAESLQSCPTLCDPMDAESLQSCLTLCDPMDHGLPGSPVHGFS